MHFKTRLNRRSDRTRPTVWRYICAYMESIIALTIHLGHLTPAATPLIKTSSRFKVGQMANFLRVTLVLLYGTHVVQHQLQIFQNHLHPLPSSELWAKLPKLSPCTTDKVTGFHPTSTTQLPCNYTRNSILASLLRWHRLAEQIADGDQRLLTMNQPEGGIYIGHPERSDNLNFFWSVCFLWIYWKAVRQSSQAAFV